MPSIRTFAPRPGLGRAALCAAMLLLASPADLQAQGLRKNELTAPIQDPVSVEIRLQQSEISIRAKQTNKAAWWFLGGIPGLLAAHNIDRTKGRQADQLASELRTLMNGLDFRDALSQRFEGGVNASVIPVLGEVRCSRSGEASNGLVQPLETPADLLSVEYTYGLIDEFSTLQVTLTAAVWSPGAGSDLGRLSVDQVRGQARYFETFTYELTPEATAGLKEPKQRVAEWLELGRDRMTATVLGGMFALADALSYDLASPGMEPELRQDSTAGLADTGHLIQEVGSQRWIRNSTGEITILEVR